MPLLMMLLFILFPAAFAAAADGLDRRQSAELLGRASSYIEADTLLDRAVAALSVVANRYYANPADKAARKDAIVAMNQLGRIYSFRFYDFRKAYTNLSTARLIAEEDGDDYQLADILVSLANIYHICSDIDDKIHGYAVEMLSEALRKAIEGGNEEAVNRVAISIAIFRIQSPDWGPYKDDAAMIRKYNAGKSGPDTTFRASIIEAMYSFFAKDYPKAEKLLKKAIGSLDKSRYVYRERFLQGTMFILQFVYDRQHKYAEEEKLLKTRLIIAKEKGLSDYELYNYESLSCFFDKMGKPDSVKKYERLFLEMKSKLDQENGMYKITEMEMLNQIGKTNDEIRELSLQRQKERRLLTVAVAVTAVVAVLLIAFVILFFNLKRNHRMLFEKNRELLEREQQLRLLMSHQEQKTQAGRGAEPLRECEADEESARLFTSILKLMEESRDIYRPGFVMDDLCGLLGVPERSVSRAINLCNGTNFHTFLNGYRIREACRLMQDTDPARHTVEHIAASVGFQSRTSFATLFKKTVGLTPSEYWKKARKGQ